MSMTLLNNLTFQIFICHINKCLKYKHQLAAHEYCLDTKSNPAMQPQPAQELVQMAYFDSHRTIKLIINGSKETRLGSILMQYNMAEGRYRVIRCDSHPTMPQVQRYSQMELKSTTVEKPHLPPWSAQVYHSNWIQIPYTDLQDVQERFIKILRNKICL